MVYIKLGIGITLLLFGLDITVIDSGCKPVIGLQGVGCDIHASFEIKKDKSIFSKN